MIGVPFMAAASCITRIGFFNTRLFAISERLAEAGIEPSVGSGGDSYDNALAETINGVYKTEIIDQRGPWSNFEAVEFATLEWADWFDHQRFLELIDNIPPAEAEKQYYAVLDASGAPPFRPDSRHS